MKKDPCLTAEAAKILGLTPASIHMMERRGELHAERTESGVRLFDRNEVEQLAKVRRERRSTPAETIVAEHIMRLLQNHQMPELARKLGLSIDELKQRIDNGIVEIRSAQ